MTPPFIVLLATLGGVTIFILTVTGLCVVIERLTR
jgi:hypothetical protein